MPLRAPHGCNAPGCGNLIRHGSYCDEHKRPAAYDQQRGGSAERGYTWRWREAAKRHLRKEPLCRIHNQRGEIVAATQVDHILAAREHPELFWNEDNWQSLCESCHSTKTREEMEARRHANR